MSLLLEFNASVDAVNDQGMSALCFAASEGHIDVMKMLCRKNARVCIILKKKLLLTFKITSGIFLYSCLPLEIMTCFWMQVIRKRDKKLKMFIVFSLQIINLIYIFSPLLLFFYFHILGRLFQVCHTEKLTDLKKIKNYKITRSLPLI